MPIFTCLPETLYGPTYAHLIKIQFPLVSSIPKSQKLYQITHYYYYSPLQMCFAHHQQKCTLISYILHHQVMKINFCVKRNRPRQLEIPLFHLCFLQFPPFLSFLITKWKNLDAPLDVTKSWTIINSVYHYSLDVKIFEFP